MLNNSPLMLVASVVALVSTGCGSSLPSSPTAAGPGTTSSTPLPQAWSGAVVLGRAGETSAQASSQTRFGSHDLIELRVDVGGIPPNVEVRATWLDSQGRVLGGEARRSRSGQQVMVFPSPSPAGLAPGHYRVQLRVGGQVVREQSFEVERAQDESGSAGR